MPVERLKILSSGARLAAVLHLPGAGRWPCLIAAHGLLSSKESDKYLALAGAGTAAGVAVCRFDFSGCGESEGALATRTVGSWVNDLHAVVGSLRRDPACDGRLAVMGSSLGGFIAGLVAANRTDLRALVSWAAPADLHDLAERESVARESGLGQAFAGQLREGRFVEVPPGVARWCIIHGARDETVPVAHAHRLAAIPRDPKALHIFPEADHRFLDPAHRAEAIKITLDWITRFL
jgi:dipeptidyl aminopeptidase/acylaminoacyl peptidase